VAAAPVAAIKFSRRRGTRNNVQFVTERNPGSRVMLDGTIAEGNAMPDRQSKFQSENLMADVYLGVMIAGVNTLIVLGAAIAFVVI
jgi:hypothetical protein